MKINTSFKGWAESFVYVLAGIYTWIDSTGLDAYVLTALALLMALDILLGWIKASTVKSLDNPTSRIAKRGILSKSVMFVIPVVVGLIWGALGDKTNAIKVVNVQLVALLIAEGYSNIANAYAIYTGEELSEFDAVTFLFKKTGQKIQKLMCKITGENDERN